MTDLRESVARAICEGLGDDWNREGDVRLTAYDKSADAAIAAVMKAKGWQDMATAPADGAEFQAWVESADPFVSGGHWEPRCRINPESGAHEIWGRVDYDHDDWGAYPHLLLVRWMQQPESPAFQKENSHAE